MYGEAGGSVWVARRKSPPIPTALLAGIQKGPFSASVRAAQLGREGGGEKGGLVGSRVGEPGSRVGAVTTALERRQRYRTEAPGCSRPREELTCSLPEGLAVETAVQQRKGPTLFFCPISHPWCGILGSLGADCWPPSLLGRT